MRDFREYNYKKENKTRILILGDSYTFGNGVELNESYAEILRKKFNEDIEIINFGVPGYGLNQEAVYFLEEGKKYFPDIILIQFTPNDFGDYKIIKENDSFYVNKITIADNEGFLISGSGKDKGIHGLHVYFLKKIRVYGFIYQKSRAILSPIINRYLKSNVPGYFLEKNSETYKKYLEIYQENLKIIKENTNAKIFFFAGPSRDDFATSEEIKKEYSLDYETNTSQIYGDLNKIAESLNISFIKINFSDLNLFIKIDGHWTPEGNKIIAESIYENLKNNFINNSFFQKK